MKRLRKIVPLQKMTDAFIHQHQQAPFRSALLQALPLFVFGPAVAAQIKEAFLSQGRLILSVPDESWRRELHKNRKKILVKARELVPELTEIAVTP